MKIKIPDALKADLPQTMFGKALGATPVVMTVVATLLAGLASSEMTRAQYARSLAAQQQSKAGDQWNFFQAKRLRSALQRSSLDVLLVTADLKPLDAAMLQRAVEAWPAAAEGSDSAQARAALRALLSSPEGRAAVELLQKGELPQAVAAPVPAAPIKAAHDAIEQMRPEAEITALLNAIDGETLAEALRIARDRVAAFDAALHPTTQAIERLEPLLRRRQAIVQSGGARDTLFADFTAARMRYAAQRYDGEARLNQAVAALYELQVRQSNLAAERHHRRSQRFFFGMLAAQGAVILATFAMVARQRNLLWSIAAAAGLGAVAFAAYVYLKV